jgi:hypothetical protein
MHPALWEFRLAMRRNVRHYCECIIEAESLEEATARARAFFEPGQQAEPFEWDNPGDDGEGDDAEALEPVIYVSGYDHKTGGERVEITVIDPHYAYRYDLLQIVRRLAQYQMWEQSVGPEEADCEVLRKLVADACGLLKS